MTRLEAVAVVELVGLPTAIEFMDAALKSANVQLLGYELAKGAGLVAVKLIGDVGAIKAAVAAGCISAEKIGKVAAKVIIPRPALNLESIVLSRETVGLDKPAIECKEGDVAVTSQEVSFLPVAETPEAQSEIESLPVIESESEPELKFNPKTEPVSLLKTESPLGQGKNMPALKGKKRR